MKRRPRAPVLATTWTHGPDHPAAAEDSVCNKTLDIEVNVEEVTLGRIELNETYADLYRYRYR